MKVAFIGQNGHHYLRALLKQPDVESAGAPEGYDGPGADAPRKELEVGRWFDDARQMLDTFKPDVVSIGSVYALNGKWAAEVVRRGIPAVSDKPVATSWEQLGELREVSKGRTLLTEFPFRTEPALRAAQDAIRQGLIGKPVLITAQKSYRFGTRPKWYAHREAYGGTLLWVASHAIDVIPFVTGDAYARATGRGGNLSRPEYGSMEDHVEVILAMKSGATAIVHADYLRPAAAATHGDDRLRVAGSKGVLEVRDGRCKLTTNDQPEADITDRATVRPIHEEFLLAMKGGSELFSTQQSLDTAEMLLKIRDAVDEQNWKDL